MMYENVSGEEWWKGIGKRLVQVKWIDTNKGDEVNHEYPSHLVANEIKIGKLIDLFSSTLCLEANKRRSETVIGFHGGDEASGMRFDFIDISCAFLQADTIREVFAQLLTEDQEPGMRGRLEKLIYRTRDAAQNLKHAYTRVHAKHRAHNAYYGMKERKYDRSCMEMTSQS